MNDFTEKEKRYNNFRFSRLHPSEILRVRLKNEHYIFAPGLYSAGGMKMAAHAGFKAGYFSGFSYAVEEHGITDVGAFSRTEMAEQAKRMVRASKYWVREQYIEHDKRVNELPLIMDLEDGHGGFGQVQMFMQHILPGGIAAGHLEDQTERRCGHLPGKVLITAQKQCERLLAARSEADQLGYANFILIARTDALKSKYPEGSMDLAIERTLEYAKLELHNRQVIDMAWCEFPNQDFEAMKFWAKAIRKEHPKMPLAVNLSSSFDWTNPKYRHFRFEELADLGFKYQFMTLADYHAGRNGSWEFFKNILTDPQTTEFYALQEREKQSGTPSISHNVMAGTDTYFVGGTTFGSESFQSDDIKETDAELSET